uniref:Uncharacterized protein n=1 Tax=viral metagenome TaxID=1070528 RepID=A0A6H1ZML0_9ZZZZ
MKTFEEKFNEVKDDENKTSYICFAEAIKGQKMKPSGIRKWFNKVVDKDDYFEDEKDEVLKYLEKLSNNGTGMYYPENEDDKLK